MNRREELERLRDAVRDGTADKAFFDATWPHAHSFEHHHALQASIGNINSAISFLSAVLPDQGWEIWRTGKYPGMIPGSPTEPYGASIGWGEKQHAYAGSPARALLLATLEALIAKEDAA